MRRIRLPFGLAALAVACSSSGACVAKETQIGPGDPPKARQCEREDTFSRELKPGCRADYLCDVDGHWLARTPACATASATSTALPSPPPAPPRCPSSFPVAGTACEGPLTCLMSRQCSGGEIGGEAYFTCEGSVWRAISDRPCVPPCSATVAKSHACGATPFCHVAVDACAHEGCWAGAWNDGTKGDTPWPCAPPPPPPEPLTAATCKRAAADQTELAQCKWTVASMSYCGGAAPPRDMPLSWPGCLCNGCTGDRDCNAGSACVAIPSTSYCLPEAKVCVKKAECVGAARTCASGCLHDGAGHGGCLAHEPPRP